MARIGLYFGSFNPIHVGHLIIAQHMANTGEFDKIRFVVSPQNPFKNESDLLDENVRLEMAKASIDGNKDFEVSDAEFSLEKPSYTIQTVNYFIEQEPYNLFSIIIGSDNLEKLNKWKDIDLLLNLCDFHIYKRRGTDHLNTLPEGRFTLHDAPFLDISATYIRELLQNKKSIQYLVHENILPFLSNI